MRTIPVNLSSEPVEAVRRARRVVGIAAAVLAGLTVLHALALWWVVDDEPPVVAGPAVPVETMRAWQQEVSELSAVADVQRARQAAAAVELGNRLLVWHTIPWSAIFADLEGLLPDRVRLEAVQPGIDAGDEVRVSMTAASADTGPLQDLLIALEASPRFREVLPQREDLGQDGLARMQLWARYVREPDSAIAGTPGVDADADSGSAEAAGGEGGR